MRCGGSSRRWGWRPSRRRGGPLPPPESTVDRAHHRRGRPRLFVDPAGRVPGLDLTDLPSTSRHLAGSSAAR